MFNAQCDALSAELARRAPLTPHNLRAAGCTVFEPRVLTADVQHRLAAYNAVRRQVVAAGCTVINEQAGVLRGQAGVLRGIEVAPDTAGLAFVQQGGCTRTSLPSVVVLHRLVGPVKVMAVEAVIAAESGQSECARAVRSAVHEYRKRAARIREGLLK